MQRWEYQTVVASGANGFITEVFRIDGESIPPLKREKSLLGSEEFLTLEAYLQSSGNEGWELAGVASPFQGGDPIWNSFFLVMKRPLPDE